MYQIVLCDDEKEILEELCKKVRNCFDGNNLPAEYTCIADARELMERIRRERIDVLFLDIDMPYYSGMDIAGYINEQGRNTLLIFVTSHDALVYETFAYRPFGFIRKAHMEEFEALGKRVCRELLENKQELVLRKGQELIRILLKDIIYMEAEGNYLLIRLHPETSLAQDSTPETGEEDGMLRIRETMTNIEAALGGKGFIRCHKGYLVNAAYMERLKSTEALLRAGKESWRIPIGRSYEKEVQKKVLELLRV